VRCDKGTSGTAPNFSSDRRSLGERNRVKFIHQTAPDDEPPMRQTPPSWHILLLGRFVSFLPWDEQLDGRLKASTFLFFADCSSCLSQSPSHDDSQEHLEIAKDVRTTSVEEAGLTAIKVSSSPVKVNDGTHKKLDLI